MRQKAILMLFLLVVAVIGIQAQQLPKLPTDPKTRIGKLDNGLTYYIRHNKYPEHVANFYIAQRVGSIQENDDQRGLAHFLEHMAFNGSKHFPDEKNSIIEYTRSLGVAFGQDLNAYTSIEETVYNINNVPTTRQSALDSCLLVLQDWAGGLLLRDEEIDKERGVIHGEWAMSNSASQRLFERNLPKMYPDCKYGERLPIGTMEVVDNFPYEALRKYYRKWYHPENQAIIVIGDIDVDHTEAQIKATFSEAKAGPDAAHVVPVMVPDNDQAIFISDRDKEMPYSIMSIMLKSEPMPQEIRGTQIEVLQDYIKRAVEMMFNNRMSELSQSPDCPFNNLGLSYGSYVLSKTKDAWDFTCVSKQGQERDAYATMVREIKRIADHGFTGTEYYRAKEEIISLVEKEYSNRDKLEHEKYYQDCVDHFLEGSAMPDADTEYNLWKAIAQNVPVEIINQGIKNGLTIAQDTNLVSYVFTQEKEGSVYLEPSDMKQILDQVRAEQVAPWVDNVKDEPLISQLPKPGKIKKETSNESLGYTELLLSNGARVILKKTDFKDDEVLLYAYAPGGECLYGEADYTNLKVYDAVTQTFGLGNFSNTELQKALAGKQATLSLSLGRQSNELRGSSTPKDLETLLQLTYLGFTSPQKDEKAFQTQMAMLETQLKNRDLRPEATLSDSLQSVVKNGDPRTKNLTVDDLKNISLDRCLEITREQYSAANRYTFVIIGNYDEASIRTLVSQYIASLPGKGKVAKTSDIRNFFNSDKVCDFKRKMETPKPYIVQMYKAEGKTTLQERILTQVCGEVLSMVLLKSVREDAGAAYSVGAYAYTDQGERVGPDYTMMQIYAPISVPEKVDLSLDLMKQGVEQVSQSADPDMVAKVKANMLKEADVNLKKNSYWQDVIQSYIVYGNDEHTGYKKAVDDITPELVSAQMKKIASGKHAVVVMRPE